MKTLGVKLALVAAVLTAAGCGDPRAPSPHPLGVTPDRGLVSVPIPVAIHGTDFSASANTDFEDRAPSTLDARFQAFLGTTALRDVRLHADGTLSATVPEGLPLGPHDLRVVDPEGREGLLAAAYRGLSPADVAQLVSSYRFDAIGAQQAWAPFPVTITAIDAAGATVADYNGAVVLSDLTGTAVPGSPALFRNGVWTGTVEVRAAHGADVLSVADPLGHAGASASFVVTPAPAAALRFATPPRSTAAGACSGPSQPLTIEVTDAFGAATVTTADLALSPTLTAGLELFADSACATPLASPVVAAGTGAVTLWFRATVAGGATVSVGAPAVAAASQLEAVVPGSPAKLAWVTAPQTIAAGSCSAASTLEVRDAWDNPTVGASVAIALAALPGAGFELFSDAACATPAATVASDPATAHAGLWFRGTIAQAVSITASGTGLAPASQTQTVTSQASASALAFVTPPRTVAAGGCSAEVTVRAQDAFGNPVVGAAPRIVALVAAPGAGFAFYSDSSCGTPVTSATIAAAASQATFWLRGTVATGVTVTASSAGLASASQGETIVAAPAASLAFSSAPQSVMAGTCSAAASLELRDAWGNVATAGAAVAVSLAATPGAGFGFYADPSCTVPVSAVAIAAGLSGADFWFDSTAAASVTVDATAAGLGGASQLETITPAVADRLVFATSPQTVGAGACSAVATVQARDPLGNVSALTSATTVALSAAPSTGFAFFSDAGCTSPISSATIAAGGSQASFHFLGNATGSFTVTPSAPGLSSASQLETVVPAAADRLAFTTAPQTVTAGGCSAAATVEATDPLGNPSAVAAATTVTLAAAPATGFAFFSDASCTTFASSVTIAASGTQAGFWFRGNGSGSFTVTASASGLASATQGATITPGAANHLDFLSSPLTVTAGLCSPALVVQSKDSLENVAPVGGATTVALSAAPSTGFTFYSDAGCSTLATSVTIAASGTQASFWFRADTAGSVLVTAADAASVLASATQTETIAPAPADRLVFLTPSRTAVAGECSLPLTVQAQDPYGNPVAATSPIALAPSVFPVAGTSFFADAACSIPLSAGEPAIIAGSSTATFRFRGTVAGAIQVTVAASGLTDAVQGHTVVAAAPAALAFATPPRTATAGVPSDVVTVELRDSFGNVAVAGAPVAVGLQPTTADFTPCGDAGCVTPIAQVTIAAGGSAASFWFRGDKAGSVLVTASDGASVLASATQTETIAPAAADHLVFTSPAQSLAAGTCSAAATVQTTDPLGNVSPVSAATTVHLLASPSAGFTFYSDSGCTSAVTSVAIAAAGTQASLWFKGTASGVVTVTASATGLTAANQDETIGAAAPSRLVFTSGAQALVAGSCSAVATVTSKDAYDNVAAVSAATAVALAAVPSTGFTFFSDSGCTSAVTAVTIASGASQATFWFEGTKAGTVTVTASVTGWTPASQDETVAAGAATHLAWDAVATPQTADRSFPVRVAALDAWGNVDGSFAGTATLSLAVSPPLTPVPTLACTLGCTGLTTSAFASGAWTGQVSVSEPATPVSTTPDRWIVATSGALTGSSNAFAVTGLPARSPPTAKATAAPAGAFTGESVDFDASGSTDYQTPTADLLVSWDFTGTATAGPGWPVAGAPWTDWTTVKTAANTFTSTGKFTVRLAVRDADGDVGYGAVAVRVVNNVGGSRCIVTTDVDVDDGATSCTNPSLMGTDGKISLREAVRVISQDGLVTFASPMTLTGTTAYALGRRMSIVGYGTKIVGSGFTFADGTSANPTRLIGLELSGQTSVMSVPSSKNVVVEDVYVHDSAGFETWSALRLERVRMENCTSACVTIRDTSSSGYLTVRASEFRGAGSGTALYGAHADGGPPTMNVATSLFIGFQRAIWLATGGATTVVNNTFEANATAIQYQGSTGHVLRNNIFTNQSVAAATLGTATFTSRDYHQLWQNASNGGLGADANTLTSDPQYLFPVQEDYRLSWGSPAANSGVDTGLYLIPAFPTSGPKYLGTAPDRGGFETW
jgi:hypothetical protein